MRTVPWATSATGSPSPRTTSHRTWSMRCMATTTRSCGRTDSVASVDQQRAGALDVRAQLFDERFDTVELALRTQEVCEAHLRGLLVEIALEVEQVRLEERGLCVLV